MSALTIASIVFVCVFGGGMLGLHLRTFLPEHHLKEDSTGVVKLGTGLIGTLAALVLGLLIASAKNNSTRSETISPRLLRRSSYSTALWQLMDRKRRKPAVYCAVRSPPPLS